jgi:DNA-binding LacI/PurR family transcriptional regulator
MNMTSLKKLAELAGVDVSTVSRALNDSPRVKLETKELIKSLALEHNYVPDDIARGLVGKRTFNIGVIIPEFRNTFYSEIIEGIESVLSNKGYSLLFGKSDFKFENEIKYMDIFFGKRVDGIIACSVSKQAIDHFKKNKRNIPLVLTDSYYKESEYDTVTIDNFYGIQRIIEHLVSSGHKKIGFIGDLLVTGERLEAYKKVLNQYSLDVNEAYISIGIERHEMGGYLRMKELLKLEDLPTAIVAETDNLAIGAIKAIREAGLTIPKNISIVGFDDITVSSYIDVPLTTVVQPKVEMGSKSAELLLNKLNNINYKEISCIIIKPELIIRNTTK